SEAVTVPFTSSVKLSLNRHIMFSWQTLKADVTVKTGADAAPTGSLMVTVDGKVVDDRTIGEADDGKVTVTLDDLRSGTHTVRAEFTPSDDSVTGSTSTREWVWVVF